MKIEPFKNESTAQKFIEWAETWVDGITTYPNDLKIFHEFVKVYHLNKESVTKEAFVKRCKEHTHTTKRLNRGICQKYYYKLCIIVDFLNNHD